MKLTPEQEAECREAFDRFHEQLSTERSAFDRSSKWERDLAMHMFAAGLAAGELDMSVSELRDRLKSGEKWTTAPIDSPADPAEPSANTVEADHRELWEIAMGSWGETTSKIESIRDGWQRVVDRVLSAAKVKGTEGAAAQSQEPVGSIDKHGMPKTRRDLKPGTKLYTHPLVDRPGEGGWPIDRDWLSAVLRHARKCPAYFPEVLDGNVTLDESDVDAIIAALNAPTPPAAQNALGFDARAHATNEWADATCNAVQWIKNIRDGISTPDEALADMAKGIEHCRAVSAAAKRQEGSRK